jgi:RimJ/RimL family protein N-acetyltransferase
MSARRMTATEPEWQLRPVQTSDAKAVVELTEEPSVFCYLFDGKAPGESAVLGWIADSLKGFRDCGVGCWLLSSQDHPCAGLVSLLPREVAAEAELAYALHPGFRGRGLATRMAIAAIRRGFESGIERIVAGVDLPNTGSIAVLNRLGMRFFRDVTYPLGAGAEYELSRDDSRLLPKVEAIAFAGED